MFTGIVRSTGRVVDCRPGYLEIAEFDLATRLEVGGSVAVNGVCLTVVQVADGTFMLEVVPETTRRTNLGRLSPGQMVNLELPLRVDQGFDGHLVQGHVDGVVQVLRYAEVDLGREVRFELPAELAPYVAPKGSITLDGTSLTVTDVSDVEQSFGVALIPHTLERTIARSYVPGTLVNVEVDIVARYVARLIGFRETAGGEA